MQYLAAKQLLAIKCPLKPPFFPSYKKKRSVGTFMGRQADIFVGEEYVVSES